MAGEADRNNAQRVFDSGVDLVGAIFADAVTDIRRRVIEQGWFGQTQDGPIGTGSKLAEWDVPEMSAADAQHDEVYGPSLTWDYGPERLGQNHMQALPPPPEPEPGMDL